MSKRIVKTDFYLRENEVKKTTGRSKQQKKKIDIHEYLIDECYDIGYKVLFTTIPLLVNELKECQSQKTLRTFEMYHLIIAYELGYILFAKKASELLFTYLSLRAGRKSTIITTNLSFERWDEIFKDPVMTAAMIDRLTHKSYMLNMNGNSHRLKEAKQWHQEQYFFAPLEENSIKFGGIFT